VNPARMKRILIEGEPGRAARLDGVRGDATLHRSAQQNWRGPLGRPRLTATEPEYRTGKVGEPCTTMGRFPIIMGAEPMRTRPAFELRVVVESPKTRPAHRQAASTSDLDLPHSLHYWRGASGKPYLHLVYSLIGCRRQKEPTKA
jgi:hypothetical protein